MEFLSIMYGTRKIPFTFTVLPKDENYIVSNAATPFLSVGKTHIISNQFTTEYESIILKCRAYIGLNEEERINALHLLIEKYSPNDKVIGNQYAQKSFHRTEIIRLDIEEASGKCKHIPMQ